MADPSRLSAVRPAAPHRPCGGQKLHGWRSRRASTETSSGRSASVHRRTRFCRAGPGSHRMFQLSLVDHIRLSFGSVATSYRAHARAAERLSSRAWQSKVVVMVLVALATAAALIALTGVRQFQIAAAALSATAVLALRHRQFARLRSAGVRAPRLCRAVVAAQRKVSRPPRRSSRRPGRSRRRDAEARPADARSESRLRACPPRRSRGLPDRAGGPWLRRQRALRSGHRQASSCFTSTF